ncbi:MAG: PilZ domain-containing protein [Desulfobulbaceae bacterium]|nr:PilZ domain-containing protein [Desulfobulbaceae bacterium]
MQEERRRHERIPPRNNAVAMMTPSSLSPFGVLFSNVIFDISESGCGFIYSGWEERPSSQKRLTFATIDDVIHVENIPIRVVVDVPFLEKKHFTVRRCGVEFKDLTDDQREKLQAFIAHQKAS